MSRRRVPYPGPEAMPPPHDPSTPKVQADGTPVPDHWVRMPTSMGMLGKWAPPEKVEEHIRGVNAILDQMERNDRKRRRGEPVEGTRTYRQDYEL